MLGGSQFQFQAMKRQFLEGKTVVLCDNFSSFLLIVFPIYF